MRLVVTFHVDGGYDCNSCERVVPVEYESAEAFLCHLDEKLKGYVNAVKKYNDDEREWYRKSPRKYTKEYEQKHREWYDTKPNNPSSIVEVGPYKFQAQDIVNNGKYELPAVRALEEWFEEGNSEALRNGI